MLSAARVCGVCFERIKSAQQAQTRMAEQVPCLMRLYANAQCRRSEQGIDLLQCVGRYVVRWQRDDALFERGSRPRKS